MGKPASKSEAGQAKNKQSFEAMLATIKGKAN